jgi:hypothetical protein
MSKLPIYEAISFSHYTVKSLFEAANELNGLNKVNLTNLLLRLSEDVSTMDVAFTETADLRVKAFNLAIGSHGPEPGVDVLLRDAAQIEAYLKGTPPEPGTVRVGEGE